MKALSIIRISNDDQKYGYGLDSQWEDDILDNAPKLGLQVSEELRRDIEERATDWDRVKFERVINEAIELHGRGQIEAVVFPRVDRETRFVFSSMPLLSAMLKAGLQVYFARELLHLDPRDPEAVSTYLNKVGQSQAYVETMRVNMMRGRKRRAGRDKLLPTGGVNLYGYFYDKNTGKRLINSDEAAVIHKMVSWVLNERISLNEVCYRLMAEGILAPRGGKRWSRGTVGRILTNETLTGKTYANKMMAVEPKAKIKLGSYSKSARKLRPLEEWILLSDDTTPQIITKSEFEAIQRQLAYNREMSPRNQKLAYLLRGMVFCRRCTRKFYGVPIHSKPYYRCSGRIKLLSSELCTSPYINAQWLETTVWSEVEKVLRNPKLIIAELERRKDEANQENFIEAELSQVEKRLPALDKQQEQLLQWALKGFPEEAIIKENEKINQERAELRKRRVELGKKIREMRESEVDLERVEEFCQLAKENLVNFTPEEKRIALEALTVRVWIDGHSVTIEGILPIPEANTVSTHL